MYISIKVIVRFVNCYSGDWLFCRVSQLLQMVPSSRSSLPTRWSWKVGCK